MKSSDKIKQLSKKADFNELDAIADKKIKTKIG